MAFLPSMIYGAGLAFTLGGLIAGTNILSTWVTGQPLTTMITDKTGLPPVGVVCWQHLVFYPTPLAEQV